MNLQMNPDAMTVQELVALAGALMALEDHFEGDEEARVIMTQYLIFKAAAQVARMSGEIRTALENEKQCDRLYKELPEKWRW